MGFRRPRSANPGLGGNNLRGVPLCSGSAEKRMSRSRKIAIPHAALAHAAWLTAALAAGAAFAQSPAPAPASPPAPAAPSSPASPATEKPSDKPDENNVLRIRGQVESIDADGVKVQLSKGISIRVDIAADTPVFSAARISMNELPAGAEVGVRSLAAPAAGDTSLAADVLSLGAAPPGDIAGLNVRGVFKSIDKSGEKPALVVAERGADRRFTLTNETTFWRLQNAQLKDLKAGELISVLIVREPSGHARAQRAVFGSPATGGMLPL